MTLKNDGTHKVNGQVEEEYFVDVDQLHEKSTTIKGMSERNTRKLWKECNYFSPNVLNKLKQIYDVEGYM